MTLDDVIQMVREAVAAEREACAQVCEGNYDTAQAARAIRARGESINAGGKS